MKLKRKKSSKKVTKLKSFAKNLRTELTSIKKNMKKGLSG